MDSLSYVDWGFGGATDVVESDRRSTAGLVARWCCSSLLCKDNVAGWGGHGVVFGYCAWLILLLVVGGWEEDVGALSVFGFKYKRLTVLTLFGSVVQDPGLYLLTCQQLRLLRVLWWLCGRLWGYFASVTALRSNKFGRRGVGARRLGPTCPPHLIISYLITLVRVSRACPSGVTRVWGWGRGAGGGGGGGGGLLSLRRASRAYAHPVVVLLL